MGGCLCDGNAMRAPAAVFSQLRQVNRQLAVAEHRVGARDVKGTLDAHAARETAEFPLDQMKGLLRQRRGGSLFARDHEDIIPEEHAQRLGGNPGHVNNDRHGLVCFQHVERWVTFACGDAVPAMECLRQLLEQGADVVGQLGGLTRRDERELRHRLRVP